MAHGSGERRIGESDGLELGERPGVGDDERSERQGESGKLRGGAERDGGLPRARGGEPGPHAGTVGDEAVADLGNEGAHLGLVHAEEVDTRGEDAGPGAFGAALEGLEEHDGVRNRQGRGKRVGGLDGQGAEPQQAGPCVREERPTDISQCCEAGRMKLG